MKKFENKYFKKFHFQKENLDQYLANALRDLEIAIKDNFPEVKFTYSYQAWIKGGIALIGKIGQVKVKSVPGHHIKILEKMSELLDDQDIFILGNAMRQKRNLDLYSGGIFISEKESQDYLNFVKGTLKKIKSIF